MLQDIFLHALQQLAGDLPILPRLEDLPGQAAEVLQQGQADGLIRLSGRIPAGGDTQSIIMSPGQRPTPRGPR